MRQKAPFYLEEDVLERASFPYVLKNPSGGVPEHELEEFRQFLEGIAPEDFEA